MYFSGSKFEEHVVDILLLLLILRKLWDGIIVEIRAIQFHYFLVIVLIWGGMGGGLPPLDR